MRICGQCGYERKEIDDILDARSCPRCGIVYDKWQAAGRRDEQSQPPVLQRSYKENKNESTDEKAGSGKPLVKYLAALSLMIFCVVAAWSVVFLYNSQNPYSMISGEITVLAIAGIAFAIIALTGIGGHGARGILVPAIFGIILNVGWVAIVGPVLNKITTDEYKLEKTAERMNKRCPAVLKDSRIDAVYYEPPNKMTFSVTLFKFAWKDLPAISVVDMTEMTKTHVIKYLKQNENLYQFYRKAEWTCIINTSDGYEYIRITISPSDLG